MIICFSQKILWIWFRACKKWNGGKEKTRWENAKTSANNCAAFKYYKYKAFIQTYSSNTFIPEFLIFPLSLIFSFILFFSFALQTSSSIKNKSVVFLSFCSRERKKEAPLRWRKENLIIEKFLHLNRNSAFKLKFAEMTRKKLNLGENIF